MNIHKINDYILKEHTKQLENILTNVAIHYNLNKKELFEKFVYTKNDSKKHKNKKKKIDPQYICMAKTQTGTQCSRSKKFGDYCGKHSKHKNKCPHDKKLCSCEPKLGRISERQQEKNVPIQNNQSNHIIVKNETIQSNQYNIEEDTQIVFNTNTKKPTVIGKKLSDNEIFFLSDLEPEEINTFENAIISESIDNVDSVDNLPTNHVNNISTSITTLLTKHSDKNIEADFNNFNTMDHNIHTLESLLNYSGDNKEEEEEMDMDDINEELGLY
tara:strand:+ start:566 stop:1381 length:816 start_codon:yes stop_codon:yes gene_type:complete